MAKNGLHQKLIHAFLLQIVLISLATLMGVYAAEKVLEDLLVRKALEGEAVPAQPPAIPFFLQFIGPHQHQHFPVLGIRVVREQHQHAVFLQDTRQPVQVRILPERVEGITVLRQLIVAVEYGDGMLLHAPGEPQPRMVLSRRPYLACLKANNFESVRT